jgi:hypothetical protein
MEIAGFRPTPEFETDVDDYAVDVPKNVKRVDVDAIPTFSRSAIAVHGETTVPGRAYSLRRPVSKIEIVVKSADGTQTNTFTVTVNRK